jgi:hypothetical protein
MVLHASWLMCTCIGEFHKSPEKKIRGGRLAN